MHKILALLLALSMLFALTACGGKDENTPTGESTGATTNTTESTNGATDGTENTTQNATESTTGGETTTPPTTTPPATTPSATTPPATTPSATTPPATTPPATTPPAASHAHSYSDKVTTAATCDKEGVKTFTCSCGHSYTEKIPAVGQHTWGRYAVYTQSTATSVGEARRNCKSCAAYESQEIPKMENKEWSVDNTINISDSAYEAAFRNYTHLYDNIKYNESGPYFAISSDNWYVDLINFLSLENADAQMTISNLDENYLRSAKISGTRRMENVTMKEAYERLVADVCANFTLSDVSFSKYFNPTRWSSLDEVPDSVFEEVNAKKASMNMRATVLGKNGAQLNCELGFSFKGDYTFSVNFNLYGFTSIN